MSKGSFRISRTQDVAMYLKDAHSPWYVELGVPLWILGTVLLGIGSLIALAIGLLKLFT